MVEVKSRLPYLGGMTTEPHAHELLTVGELAERSGVATSALRFYEDRGLIFSFRTESGHRRYPRAMARIVAFILFAQRVGLTLEEVRAELRRLPPGKAPNAEEWALLSGSWAARIEERIAELERLKRGLTDCIGCGCLSLERCKLLNPGDRVAARGPGPRFWIDGAP
jgi:MerR family transcriptional regulator, redox-sensitive transcriptional activator SoxR